MIYFLFSYICLSELAIKLHVKQLIMTTFKLPLRKIIKTLLAFIVSWIGVMAVIAIGTLTVKLIGLYVSYIWNLWL